MDKRRESRDATLDTARGIGILLVVIGHALRQGMLRQILYSFHVPLFFFLAGLTYHYSEDRKNVRGKRLKRIILPYFLVSLISLVVYLVLGSFAARKLQQPFQGNPGELLLGMIYGNSRILGHMKYNQPLWFLPCLIIVYSLADSFLKDKARKKRAMIVTISSAALFCVHFLFLKNIAFPWGIEQALFLFPFFIAGQEEKQVKRLAKIGNKPFVSTALLMVTILLSRINGFAQIRNLDMGRIPVVFAVTSLCGTAAVYLLSTWFSPGVLERIGQSSMMILLFHKFPVLFFQTVISPTGNLLEKGGVAGTLTAVIISAVSVALCVMFERILTKTRDLLCKTM